MMKIGLVCIALLLSCEASSPVEPPLATLAFRAAGQGVTRLDTTALARLPGVRDLALEDPNYHKRKRFRAVPMARVLAAGFGSTDAVANESLVLRALDGYTVPMSGARLLETGAYLAFADLDVPAWEQMPDKKASVAPFYIVWTEPQQTDTVLYPRPYQLSEIAIARYEDLFPHTLPTRDTSVAVQRGLAIFRRECIHCHAINRQGGRVGPELNVPQSIVEYRPVAQLRAYIKNPLAFRYTSMPPHPGFTDEDLDGLVAYFHAMSLEKRDEP